MSTLQDLFINFRQTDAYAAYMRQLGWETPYFLVNQKKRYGFVKKIPLLPISVMKIQRIPLEEMDWEWLKQTEKQHHVFQTNIETNAVCLSIPDTNHQLTLNKLNKVNDYLLVSKTRIISIKAAEDELLLKMTPKTRYNIHLGQRHQLKCHFYSGTEIAKTTELEAKFKALLSKNAKRIGMYLIPWPWISRLYGAFGSKAWIGVVTHPSTEEWLAASLFIRTDKALFYHFNGSNDLGRKWMGPTLLIWEAIKKARALGCIWFDFEGVYDERYPRQQAKFKGFSQFKTGFGGQAYFFESLYRRYRWPY